MKPKYAPFVLALIILLALPLGFFFYYKTKIDALPREAEKVASFWKAPEYALQTHWGDTLTSTQLLGSIYVADFIFTNCTGVCPNLSMNMAQLQETFREEPQVKFISFTIDPVRDSLPVLQEYAGRYGAEKGKWFFLRGDTTRVWGLAAEGFKVPVVYTPQGGTGNEFTHTDRMILVDETGMIRGFYKGMEKADMDSLNNNIARLLLGNLKQ